MAVLNEMPALDALRSPSFLRSMARLLGFFGNTPRRTGSEIDTRVGMLLDEASQVENRIELEALLGRPRFQLSGALFSCKTVDGQVRHPDVVEVYYMDDVVVHAWFIRNSLVELQGHPSLSP